MSKKLPKYLPKNVYSWACVRIDTPSYILGRKSGKAKIQCLCGFPGFLIFTVTHLQKWSKKYSMSKDTSSDPKKGKVVGSAVGWDNRIFEWHLKSFWMIFQCKLFRSEGWLYVMVGWCEMDVGQIKADEIWVSLPNFKTSNPKNPVFKPFYLCIICY